MSTYLYLAGLGASLAVLLALNIADLCAQWEAEGHISQMQQVYEDADEDIRLEYLRQARLYNQAVAGEDPGETPIPYRKQLFYKEEPMMSFIEIPAISVRLPIYHGTQQNALMAGVGHWEGSSLPVGGAGTRCVLMGHSGMRNTRMFDDLRKLAPGDKLLIRTLNDPYCYEVFATQTVKPAEVPRHIAIEPGHDLVTLVTCTPIGVNSHRLLVHARRCPYREGADAGVGVDAYVNDRNLPLIVAGAFTLMLAMATGTRHAGIRTNRKKGKPHA